jgi:hypothetical protein
MRIATVALFLLASVVLAAPKRIVLVSGDDEYRSEEALPQLAKILSERHGFQCTVLYAIDPKDGTINPTVQTNIPGLEALAKADLMIMGLRFRDLPDEQMKHIVDYVEAGKPVVALRTSTHAFNLRSSQTYAKWNYNSKEWPGGFGRQVLGQVLTGMKETDGPVAGPQNEPMMPVAWVKTNKGGRIFTTTMGAATDLENEELRRLVVNAAYWAMGLEKKIKAKMDVRVVGEYKPSPFKFNGHIVGRKP